MQWKNEPYIIYFPVVTYYAIVLGFLRKTGELGQFGGKTAKTGYKVSKDARYRVLESRPSVCVIYDFKASGITR
jgi:hypothetical protein